MSERTPLAVDTVFTLGMKAGAATAIEMVHTFGYQDAAEVTYQDMLANLTGQERAILAAAFGRIRELRTAPADPSPLAGSLAPIAAPCPDSSCRICAIGGPTS